MPARDSAGLCPLWRPPNFFADLAGDRFRRATTGDKEMAAPESWQEGLLRQNTF
jgi:hypothetical protein